LQIQSTAEFCKAADKTGTTLYRKGFDSVNLDSLTAHGLCKARKEACWYTDFADQTDYFRKIRKNPRDQCTKNDCVNRLCHSHTDCSWHSQNRRSHNANTCTGRKCRCAV